MVDQQENRQPPLADRVYGRLFEQLMNGGREPGESLNIVLLSREMEASQTPIREALARLEHTGLVRREALKGYRVAPLLSERELIKLMDARLVLEPAMTYEAARRLTPEFLDDVLGTIEALDGLTAQDAPAFTAYWSADHRFHQLISEQTDNPFLVSAFGALGGQVQRFRLYARAGSWNAGFAAREHREIYDAFLASDPQRAADGMRRHLTGAKERALEDTKDVVAAD